MKLKVTRYCSEIKFSQNLSEIILLTFLSKKQRLKELNQKLFASLRLCEN